jgi:hypothetical protein
MKTTLIYVGRTAPLFLVCLAVAGLFAPVFAQMGNNGSQSASKTELDIQPGQNVCPACGGRELAKETCPECGGKDRTKELCSSCGGVDFSKKKCDWCNGRGRVHGDRCFYCGGTGKRRPCDFCGGTGHKPACFACGGTGKKRPCSFCGGKGVVNSTWWSRSSGGGSSSGLSIGSTAQLRGLLESSVVFTEMDAYEDFVKAAQAKDHYGIDHVVASGKALFVPNYTKVLVIDDDGSFGRKIRITEGKYAGIAGWVPIFWLEKA